MYNDAPRKYDRVAIYLRKSRKDEELEKVGAEDTLQRHRRVLLELAKHYELTVTRIYEEVVSGDTIDGRPEMQRLLRDVEAGAYDAVLCHDIDRLGRGAMRDQGTILETFKWSHTAIITPDKIYDLDADMDEEAVEFKTLSARYEYRMIKKRLARGREASVREGKFIGNTAPYGYERYKLQGQKGWSLRPSEPAASVVRDMYRWFTAEEDRIGVSLIARRLNERGIPGPAGKDWTNCAVRSILSNPEYAGFIRSGLRPAQKAMDGGELVTHRPRSSEPTLYPGLHEPIISKEISDRALSLLANNKSRPGPKQVPMKNPLSGLVICDQCGRAMVRRPYSSGYPDGLLCPYSSCSCVSSTLETVEAAILDGLRAWLTDLSLSSAGLSPCPSECGENFAPPSSPSFAVELASLSRSISSAEAELERLRAQRRKAYDLVEQGVYTPEVFTSRMASLGESIAAAEAQIAALTQETEKLQSAQKARSELIPNIRHVLDAYDLAETPEEKNALLRSVLSSVTYHKTRRARWSGGSDLTLTLHPIIE